MHCPHNPNQSHLRDNTSETPILGLRVYFLSRPAREAAGRIPRIRIAVQCSRHKRRRGERPRGREREAVRERERERQREIQRDTEG